MRRVDLREADFGGATLTRAEILDSHAEAARFDAAKREGAIFRKVDLRRTTWEGALPTRIPAGPARLERFAAHSLGVSALCCDPTGQLLATCSGDATIRLWDAVSLEEIAVLCGHEGWLHSVAFSPDGASLASTGYDGTVRLWDVASGGVRLIRAHFDAGAWASIDPVSNRILHSDGDVWRWLGWSALRADGRIERYPVPIFGALPGPSPSAEAAGP